MRLNEVDLINFEASQPFVSVFFNVNVTTTYCIFVFSFFLIISQVLDGLLNNNINERGIIAGSRPSKLYHVYIAFAPNLDVYVYDTILLPAS